MLSDQEKSKLVKAICDSIVETVREAGSMGAPAGPMYAAMMQHGFTLEQFEQIMGSLIRIGQLRRSGNLYFIPKPKSSPDRDFGGAFDGFRVTSDSDSGL